MTSVLVLGIDPRAIPGMDGEAVRARLEAELSRFANLGIEADITLLRLDETTEDAALAALVERRWDVVVVGGGIRKPTQLLELFEWIVNMIRREAPQAAIAFNTSGGDSVEAAKRWL
ncbi:hypothetical protein FOE78_20640 [Microlunatus elymi]|uniref:Uncharacterized protein n=1 Tax=Microlunatus elymi TaxID=2596828 RepID=A0A516Q3H3_9ACTN|nr:hypothetical protein [Microlunatus elymi]QDP97987.1 hypothetical protein FOE78_20640 [Microlunatus elymi]